MGRSGKIRWLTGGDSAMRWLSVLFVLILRDDRFGLGPKHRWSRRGRTNGPRTSNHAPSRPWRPGSVENEEVGGNAASPYSQDPLHLEW